MPTASPSSQPQVITQLIYFPDEMLNGAGMSPSLCARSCSLEVIRFFHRGGSF